MEKISDKSTRLELVKAFKQKIRKEIHFILNRNLKELKTYSYNEIREVESETYMDFETNVLEVSCCLYLEKWLSENDFMNFTVRAEDSDQILYTISSRHLKLWSQDDFYFVRSLCMKYGLNFNLVNHYDLEYCFTDLSDEMLFDKRTEENYSKG